jgi:hypothetical protein
MFQRDGERVGTTKGDDAKEGKNIELLTAPELGFAYATASWNVSGVSSKE